MACYRGLTSVQHSILKVKALDSTFNQEKALVGAFSVIVKTDGSFAALLSVDVFRTRSVELL